MNSSHPGLPADTPDDGPTTFRRRRLHADAHTAGQARTEFARWLQQRFSMPADRRSDVVLAVNEALANAAEHAYAASPHSGSVDVDAHYDAARDTLTVSVADRGRWRPSESSPRPSRGRGIQLMRALANRFTIDTTADGTRVNMSWGQLRAQPSRRRFVLARTTASPGTSRRLRACRKR